VATREIEIRRFSGYRALLVILAAGSAGVALWAAGAPEAERRANGLLITLGVMLVVGAVFCLRGLVVVAPNEAKVATLLGRYRGTLRDSGFHWISPFTSRQKISLRVRNLDSDVLKVNDAAGNPVEIAAVINWQVGNTAMASFDVESYLDFVGIQAETAVRHVASEYPYDAYELGQRSLRANADDVAATLQAELQDRLQIAGVEVLDTRLRRLAYAPEIAGEMLRRQQASAVVAARGLIVEGALGMVQGALDQLETTQLVDLSQDQRAQLVSNLLVVLVSDRGTQPVVNAGA
jgi:regulator of protease activity HflC (stomatin/prohibitin superfamily)